jgi:hypothetical protein
MRKARCEVTDEEEALNALLCHADDRWLSAGKGDGEGSVILLTSLTGQVSPFEEARLPRRHRHEAAVDAARALRMACRQKALHRAATMAVRS